MSSHLDCELQFATPDEELDGMLFQQTSLKTIPQSCLNLDLYVSGLRADFFFLSKKELV